MVEHGAPIVGNILNLITRLQNMAQQNWHLQGEVVGKFNMLKAAVDSAKCNMANYEGDEDLMLEMQELLLDIQDYLCELHIPEILEGFLKSLIGTDSRPESIPRIESFLTSISNIKTEQDGRSKEAASKATTPSVESRSEATIPPSAASTSSAASSLYAPEDDLEGFPETKNDFMELLSLAQGGPQRRISIVGCHGLGKTTLARAVYDDVRLRAPITLESSDNQPREEEIQEEAEAEQSSPTVKEIFDCKAWIVGSTCNDARGLLNKILHKFPLKAADRTTSKDLEKFLVDKRYFVIIDDLSSNHVPWKDIKCVFPENNKGSRIIVTTSVHSIAMDYSSGSNYVYPMQCLGEVNSERLFYKKVFGTLYHKRLVSIPQQKRSETILAKCDGLPVALISAGNYPCREHVVSHLCDARYDGMCQELDNIVASKEVSFDDLKRMFVRCYGNLTDYDHKNCLLYLSIYPKGHEINSKSIVRRLKGEELVAGDASACWKKLIDNSMIDLAPIRNNYNVAKRCKVQGMMMEFAIQKSVSRNLVTLVEDGKVRRKIPDKKVRRLTVQFRSSNEEYESNSNSAKEEGSSHLFEGSSYSSTSEEERSNLIPHGIDLSTVRSVTIFKRKHPAETNVNNMDFKSCKMMRVLDLEGCKGLVGTVLDGICELLFLNYLSLRNTDVDELPTRVKKLDRLETLDIRQTRVAILPVEVIMLPMLAHLFGEFELPQLCNTREKEALIKFLKEKSKLETLAGIVINNAQGFETVIQHAKELKKIKLCGSGNKDADAVPVPTIPADLKKKITSLFRKKKNTNVAASVSNSATPSVNGQQVTSSRQNDHSAKVLRRRLVEVLVSTLQKRSTSLDSISIDSSCISNAFLASTPKRRVRCITSSIKLRGPLTSLTARTFEDLPNLTKLHLFSTRLSSENLVKALKDMNSLEYLKLVEGDTSGSWDGVFSVPAGGFPALLVLCFEGSKKHPSLNIVQNAMSNLESLQLLCPAEATVQLQRPLTEAEAMKHERRLTGVMGIQHLENLTEVILHHSADDEAVEAWKVAAKNHIKMPCVKRLPAQPISPTKHEF